MKNLLALLILGMVLAMVPACEDDSTGTQPIIPEPPALTQKWQVLSDMELAHTKRNLAKYDALLDANFMFYLSNGDVQGGLPDSWDRDVEMYANANLFSKDPLPAPMKRCLSLQMNIKWEDSNGDPR